MDFDEKRWGVLSGVMNEAEIAETPDDAEVLSESASTVTKENMSTEDDELVEVTLRKVIRTEIESIVKQMSKEQPSNSSWMYGGNQPKNTGTGRVTMGMLGVGFKR